MPTALFSPTPSAGAAQRLAASHRLANRLPPARLCSLCGALALALGGWGSVQAQSTPAAPSVPATETSGPGQIVVTGQSSGRLTTRNILTTVDVLGSDQVEERQVMNSWELLGQLPGVQLTETRMGAESGKASFRAFNGEGYINGIKVLIDGIPSNVNSGNQRFIDMVFPLDIDFIEVVRGTNDPRHGLHNIGGNLNVVTRQGGRYNDARLTLGSFATRELQLALGREADGLAQNYFIGHQRSDGHRDHAASDKLSLGGKWFLTTAGGALRLGLIARAYTHDAEEPGFMTAAQLAENRRQSFAHNANDGDDRRMQQASLHVDWKPGADLLLASRLYFNRYRDDRRVSFTGSDASALNNLPRQRRLWDEDQQGLSSTLTWQARSDVVVDAGVQIERQDNRYRRYRYAYALPTNFSQPVTTSNDDAYTLNNLGAYVQVVYQATPRLKIVPAWRVDRFDGDTRIQTSGVTGELQDYGSIQQPKLSLVYSPSASTSLYANWGRSFQVLTGSRAPAYITSATQPRFSPSINTGQELGLKWAPNRSAELRVAAWQQDATDEVANMPSTGTTVGLGQTRRRGLDLQASLRLGQAWSLSASHSVQEAKVVQAFTAAGVSLAGKEVFATPRRISTAQLEFTPTADWKLGLQARAQGSYYIDDLNAQGKYGDTALLDLSVRRALTPAISLDLQVRNLTDREHAYTWYDNFFWPAGSAQPMFSPGAPRAAYLSVNVKM